MGQQAADDAQKDGFGLDPQPDDPTAITLWAMKQAGRITAALAERPTDRNLSASRAIKGLLDTAVSAAKRAELEKKIAELEEQVEVFLEAADYGQGFANGEDFEAAEPDRPGETAN
jgi:hypothetical protein